MSSWLFQGNPKFYKIRPALHHFRTASQPTSWWVQTHKSRIRAGDDVFFWEAVPQAGLVGWGKIETDPEKLTLGPDETPFIVVKAKFDGSRLRVKINVQGVGYWSRGKLRKDPVLGKWAPVARGVEGTNFAIPANVLPELRRIVS